MQFYTIKDTAVSVFYPPFNSRNRAEAIRMFSDAALRPDSVIGVHPEHFQLFYIGDFDDETGEISSVYPEFVWSGQQAVTASLKSQED